MHELNIVKNQISQVRQIADWGNRPRKITNQARDLIGAGSQLILDKMRSEKMGALVIWWKAHHLINLYKHLSR